MALPFGRLIVGIPVSFPRVARAGAK